MLSWHFVTREEYDNASESDKSSNKIFFLKDTNEIYKGTENYTANVIMYDTEPTTKAIGKLYVNSNTHEGKIWDGSDWVTILYPIYYSTTYDEDTDTVTFS